MKKKEKSNIIYSDEKKFNLCGPDGIQKYWIDPKAKPKIRKTTSNSRLLGVTAFCAFSKKHKCELFFFDSTVNTDTYCEMLEKLMIPFIQKNFKCDFLFQQDNARPHVSHNTKSFLKKHNIRTLQWPAQSPDLSPVENIWSILSEKVYRNSNVYSSLQDLKNSIISAWNDTDIRKIKKQLMDWKRDMRWLLKMMEEKFFIESFH